MHRLLSRWIVPALLVSIRTRDRAGAVILYSTATRNTDPPGSLTNRDPAPGPQGADDPRRLLNSGWQYQGAFRGFLATPIGSQFFVTAQHIGGGAGSTIDYNGVTYTTTGYWDHVSSDPNEPHPFLYSDLRIWKISGTFPTWAPMWDANVDGSEVGKSLVVYGRGTQRGNAVTVGGQLKGWEWGASDGAQSWGENVVTGITNFKYNNDNKLLYFDFDADGGPNEAALSVGDSGGGEFINSGGVWKLAGINNGVDGPFRYTADGTEFNASIFDAGGLYAQYGSLNNWQLVPDGAIGSSYATRIAEELSWINSTIAANAVSVVPEPVGMSVILMGITWWMKRPRRA